MTDSPSSAPDWNWLDPLVCQLDEDAGEASSEEVPQKERLGLKQLFDIDEGKAPDD